MAGRFQEEWVQDTLHIRMFKAEWRRIGVGWNTRDVQSTYWRFYRNDRDGASLELPTGLYPLQGQRLYFVPAGVRFSCRNVCALQHFYVHFDVIGLPTVAMRELFHTPLCLPPAPVLEQAVQNLAEELAAGRQNEIVVQCRLKAMLYEGLARGMETFPPEQMARCVQRAAALEPVLPAIRHIEENLAEPLTNSRLSALCHMSENFFIRQFRQCVGQTPARYITERRVMLAAQRLLFTEQTIDQIADALGFGNRFYFTRVFARHLGVPPAAYRKAARV